MKKLFKKTLVSLLIAGATFIPIESFGAGFLSRIREARQHSYTQNYNQSYRGQSFQQQKLKEVDNYINSKPGEKISNQGRHVFENVLGFGVGSGTQKDEEILRSTKGAYDLIIKTGYPTTSHFGYTKDILDAIVIDAQIRDKESYLNSTTGKLFGKIVEEFGPCEFKEYTTHSRAAYLANLEKEYGSGRIKIGKITALGPEIWSGELKHADEVRSNKEDPISKITKPLPRIEVRNNERGGVEGRITLSYGESFDSFGEIPGIIMRGLKAPFGVVEGLASIPGGSLKHHATDSYGITGENLQQKYNQVTVVSRDEGVKKYRIGENNIRLERQNPVRNNEIHPRLNTKLDIPPLRPGYDSRGDWSRNSQGSGQQNYRLNVPPLRPQQRNNEPNYTPDRLLNPKLNVPGIIESSRQQYGRQPLNNRLYNPSPSNSRQSSKPAVGSTYNPPPRITPSFPTFRK